MDRKKIFGIFGGFLAVIFVFTLLSRAVAGASMARVETVKIGTGKIEHKVTGSGRVNAEKEIAVFTESGQRVKEICVQEGQSVEKGDVLFYLDMDELKEQILAMEQEMEKVKLQNQDTQNAKDVERQNRATQQGRAKEDYSQAVSQGDAAIAEAKANWDAAEAELQNFLQNVSKNDVDRKGAEKKNNDENVKDKSKKSEDDSGTGQEDTGKSTNPEDNSGEESEDTGKSGESEDDSGENQGEEPEDTPQTDGSSSWEAQKAALEQAVAEAKSAYQAAVSAREENVKTARRALEDASSRIASDSTSRQNEITMQQQELALEKFKSLQDAEGKITAPVKGTIMQISITTGDFTTEGTAIRMADTSGGSRLVVSVDKSNEEYVSKGSPVNIKASGSKEEITDYTVSNVAVNETDKELLDVTIDLPEGVLEPGTSAEVEIVNTSENYNAVIPIQALHEEENGYYVLVLYEEQGVMGTELVTRRLSVEVLDKNNTDAALAYGTLTSEQEIISSSSKSIGEGSRVRRKE